MHHLLKRTGVAGVCALGFLAAQGSAQALSPLSLEQSRSLVVPIADEETLSVEEDLRPDEVPEAMKGEEAGKPMMDSPSEEMEGGETGNMEDEMIDKIGPGAE